MGNSFPLRWDDTLENLPEGGWDWAFKEAVKDHKEGSPPNYHCAIQVIIHPDYRGHGLSVPMIQAVRALTRSKGLQALIIPIRPNEKSNYPLISLDDYITWKTEEGLPLDAWLRVHTRLGGRIIKICHESKTIRGTHAEWEEWTGMKFPQSGQYVLPGALNPIEMSIEKNVGTYIEPNVWMVHEIG
jgi:GNAT superfamily N-acetyltransferase